jgi:hypothetical protein
MAKIIFSLQDRFLQVDLEVIAQAGFTAIT